MALGSWSRPSPPTMRRRAALRTGSSNPDSSGDEEELDPQASWSLTIGRHFARFPEAVASLKTEGDATFIRASYQPRSSSPTTRRRAISSGCAHRLESPTQARGIWAVLAVRGDQPRGASADGHRRPASRANHRRRAGTWRASRRRTRVATKSAPSTSVTIDVVAYRRLLGLLASDDATLEWQAPDASGLLVSQALMLVTITPSWIERARNSLRRSRFRAN